MSGTSQIKNVKNTLAPEPHRKKQKAQDGQRGFRERLTGNGRPRGVARARRGSAGCAAIARLPSGETVAEVPLTGLSLVPSSAPRRSDS